MKRRREPVPDLNAIIAKHGWAVRHVRAGRDGAAPFSYTIGLTATGLPEVVTTGLPPEMAQEFLNMAGALMRDGTRFRSGEYTSELAEGAEVLFLAVEDVSGLTAVADLYGAVIALQLVWPDSGGAFPWQLGYRNPSGAQPLLGPVPAGPDGTVSILPGNH